MTDVETIKKAVKEYDAGGTISFVSKKYKIPTTSLGRYIREHGVWRRYTPRKKKVPDLKGTRYGKLVAVKPIVEKGGRVLWMCECDCGTVQKIRQTHLVSGKREMCGNCRTTGDKNHSWSGCGDLSGTYWKRLRENAKRRASGPIEFEITIQYAWSLYKKQKGRCALSGLSIPMPQKVQDGFLPSLDRIDSSQGYIEGNVQWVHKDVNTMKWDLDQSYFLEMCALITNNGG